MKKVLFLLIIIALSGCKIQKYGMLSYGVDLSRFSEKGFLISTTDISQRYTSVAIVSAVCQSGVDREMTKEEKRTIEDGIYKQYDYVDTDYRPCILDDVLDEIYQEAIERGANGIIQLKLDQTLPSISVTGLAVKLEN